MGMNLGYIGLICGNFQEVMVPTEQEKIQAVLQAERDLTEANLRLDR